MTQRFLKEYENLFPWINKTIEYQVKVLLKKCVSIFVTTSINDIPH